MDASTLKAIEALLEHLDNREGESLREMGKPKALEVSVEAEPGDDEGMASGGEADPDCPECQPGHPCAKHTMGEGGNETGGLAAKLAALKG